MSNLSEAYREAEQLWNENTQEPLPVNKTRMILAIAEVLAKKDRRIAVLEREKMK